MAPSDLETRTEEAELLLQPPSPRGDIDNLRLTVGARTDAFADGHIVGHQRSSLEVEEGGSVPDGNAGQLDEETIWVVARHMYCSHFLSRWGDRMWEFAVALFMIRVWKDSLVLTALYGLVEASSVAIFGVFVGKWVDAHPRMKAVRTSIAVQNASMIGAAVGVILLLMESAPEGPAFFALVALVNVLGGVQALAGLANNIAVERDWVVVVSNQAPPSSRGLVLSRLNSTMRRIDLTCKLMAPVAAGLLMSLHSAVAAALFIAVWNALSTIGEYYLLQVVYQRVPALAEKEAPAAGLQHETPEPDSENGRLQGEQEARSAAGSGSGWRWWKRISGGMTEAMAPIRSFARGWKVYAAQETALAGVALAGLYFTVLSFGSLMTAVLSWRGISPLTLGLARAIAALVGIASTVCYPVWHRQVQGLRTGLRAIWLQWAFLLPCLLSLWLADPTVASWLLIGGVTCSRFGLWLFDLAVTQLMQESIRESDRGVVGGVQSSLQEAMSTASYLAGILVSNPQDFGILVAVSFFMVTSAAVSYTVFCWRTRGHLFHLDKLKMSLPTFRGGAQVDSPRGADMLRLRTTSSVTSPAA